MSQAELTHRPIIWLNTVFLTVTPLLALAASIAYGMEVGITWREVSAALVIWGLTGLGITVGNFNRAAFSIRATSIRVFGQQISSGYSDRLLYSGTRVLG